jgi:hypothetical protein
VRHQVAANPFIEQAGNAVAIEVSVRVVSLPRDPSSLQDLMNTARSQTSAFGSSAVH